MLLTILSTLTFLFTLVMNYLSNSIPIGGRTQSDISAEYPSMFTPAGFTFSIWGLIYTLLIVFLVLLFTNTNILSEHKSTILLLFIFTNILNSLWLYFWHTDQIVLSTLIMLSLLVSLLIILTLVSSKDTFAFATFSIYAGWISVATVANIAILLIKLNYPIFMNHESIWFGVILFVTLIIGGFMLIKERNYYFAGVFLWAYIGIASKYTP